jgi:hypothetical protein
MCAHYIRLAATVGMSLDIPLVECRLLRELCPQHLQHSPACMTYVILVNSWYNSQHYNTMTRANMVKQDIYKTHFYCTIFIALIWWLNGG